MAAQPLWRRGVEEVERRAAPRVDEIVRSDAFAAVLRTSLVARNRMLARVEPYSRSVLHALNLPTASDIRLLRKQISDLERRLLTAAPEPKPSRGGLPRDSRSGDRSR
jgi:hypothetical protein